MLQHRSSNTRSLFAVTRVLFPERIRLPRLRTYPVSVSLFRSFVFPVDDSAPSLRALSSHSGTNLLHLVDRALRSFFRECCFPGRCSHSRCSDQGGRRARRLHFVRILSPLFTKWRNRINAGRAMSRNTDTLCSTGVAPHSDRNRCVCDEWRIAWRRFR